GPWRGDKGTCFAGGFRLPCIVWAPGRVAAGRTSAHVTTAMDVLPTIAALTGSELPGQTIDGRDMSALWTGVGTPPEHEAVYFYYPGELHAVRSGRWKLHAPHHYRSVEEAGSGGLPGKYGRRPVPLSLFDLEADPGESHNVADQYPEVVARLEVLLERARAELGDTLTQRVGSGVREPVLLPKVEKEAGK
ncbi:MAG: sulfatase-like hydrolase/transferase, partial [Planctomycetota bacterium]